ncbi:hypothetical protein DOS79_09545 [Staphylococcus felis]|uniref:Uncharacterized protein n=1 Tax=Staphylococcus felis TaxID=46127 RepID=A0AAX1RVU0_9STAP|nr:hypothetical protein [Staphylococcus felis]REH76181.1 hypothetical protein DOS59_08755 [Staphylococcus felis]REH85305.1 hypothetical protein DOS63_05535 [Staphylococcus felis]REH86517.1 hypothetical protein DOS56_00145 [Staphylococcus felis]REH99001.1 hypothetical protein DOS64_10010 [Staphylococcus felis]REI15541.1 hypothetical protein DOS75_09445 [Staphylococcus felis]
MENEKMLITIERYDKLIGERAVYKQKVQELSEENLKLQIEASNKIPILHLNTQKSNDDEDDELLDDEEEELLDE